jgi:hypothetical protein
MLLPKSSGDQVKDQILDCMLQLAARCEELGYTDLESTLCITVAASISQKDCECADALDEFAVEHMPEMRAEMERLDNEDNEDKEETEEG